MKDIKMIDIDALASTNALIDKRLDIFFWPPSRAGVMSAWWGHVPFAHWLVAVSRPSTIVELGTHNGASFAAFCEAVHREKIPARCFAIDTWQGDEHAGMYGEKVYADIAHFTSSHYGAFAELIRTTFDDAQPYFAAESIDLLHIDGLHTYEAVKHDFENWLPKMSDRGVVLFHDTNVRERDFGVWRLWQELQARFPSFEFSHAHGLGVLAVGARAPQAVLDLCHVARTDHEALHRLRERFALLGARLVDGDMARRYAEHAGQLELANGHLQATLDNERRLNADREIQGQHLHDARTEADDIRRRHEQAVLLIEEARRERDEAIVGARRDKAEVSLANDAAQRLKAENDALKEEGTALRIRIDELRLQNEALTTQSEALQAANDALDLERQGLQKTNEAFKVEGESVRAEHASMGILYRSTKAENDALKAQNESLASRNQQLQEEGRRAVQAIQTSTSWRVTRPLRALQPRGVLRKLSAFLPVGRRSRSDLDPLAQSGFFDENFYAGSEEARRQGKAPLQHYLDTGEAVGLAPSAAFDPIYYRRRNPDVVTFTGGLLRHYVQHGHAEGRVALSAVQQLALPREGFDSSRPCMVIAVHEATRTGAAILSWNLVREFSKTYDVVTLLRRGGPIEKQFHEASRATIVLSEGIYGQAFELDVLVERMIAAYRPQFVVANSVETRNFVPAFERAGIPCVALVHEFSPSVRPLGVLHELFECASSVVFSAHIVADSALADYGVLAARDYQVIPQGASELPPGDDPSLIEVEVAGAAQTRLKTLQGDLAEIDPDAFLVVGLGTITPRKGVEFFIATADRACRLARRRKFVFAWVGKHYAFDEPYLESLMEQVQRSGLNDSFVFLGEFADLDPVYERADACLLSSRLDPLPNVAIDAALAGVPVVCFDQGSGFAEILNESDATRGLVVPYLDAAAAAEVLCRLAETPEALSQARVAIRQMADKRFDMPDYVARIERLGLTARTSIQTAAKDEAFLLEDGRFNPDLFSSEPDPSDHLRLHVAKYLNGSRLVVPRGRARTGWLVRRPLEGFHPLVYAGEAKDFHEARDSDPLVHFLRSGSPPGRWRHEVIRPEAPVPKVATTGLKVAIHGHFYYPELLADFLQRVRSNKTRASLYLTTTTPGKADVLRRSCEEAGFKDAEIIITGNRGRDIGPMLAGLPPEVFAHHDIVGHFHGKRSPHVEESVGGRWREFLWQHLLGSSHPMMDNIVQAFAANPSLGLVFAEDPHLNGWDSNLDDAERLAARMELKTPLPAHFDFPQGTMFWVRPAALKPILDLGLSWQDFPPEPVPIDGTVLHALERLMTFAAEKAGFVYATTYVKNHRR